jgi:hypothetical protein
MVTKRAEAQGLDRCDVRFTRREVRDDTGWSDFPVRMHLEKLTELEYLLVHRGGPGQRFVYELLYDGQGGTGEVFLTGLLDVETLESHGYDANREGREADCEPTLSPGSYPLEAAVSLAENDATPSAQSASPETASEPPETTTGERRNAATVITPLPLVAAPQAR